MEKTFTLSSLEELEEVARFLFSEATDMHAKDNATVIALSGELGAGKTALVQTLGILLGVEDTMVSPTFILERVYPVDLKSFRTLVHIDAYRLDSPEELETINFAERAKNPENLICVEWAEQIKEAIPKDALWVSIESLSDTKRVISVSRESPTDTSQ